MAHSSESWPNECCARLAWSSCSLRKDDQNQALLHPGCCFCPTADLKIARVDLGGPLREWALSCTLPYAFGRLALTAPDPVLVHNGRSPTQLSGPEAGHACLHLLPLLLRPHPHADREAAHSQQGPTCSRRWRKTPVFTSGQHNIIYTAGAILAIVLIIYIYILSHEYNLYLNKANCKHICVIYIISTSHAYIAYK